MFIRKIQLKNGYKRFKDLTIDLGNVNYDIVALVGPNGSGKSSVFDGILYLQGRYSHIGSGHVSDINYHSMDRISNYNDTWRENVQIEFDKGNHSEVYNDKNTAGKGKTLFCFRSPYRYSSDLKVSELRSIGDIKDNNIGAGATIHLDQKITDNYKRLYSYIDRSFKKEGSTQTYSEIKKTILGDFNASLCNVLDIEITDHGDILDGNGTLYFKKKNQPKIFDFNVLSSGEKEVVDILLDVFLKKDEFSDSIYIIDEPELHINTSIQRTLLQEIYSMIPIDCQLWIATHSIGFLNALKQDYDNSCIIWFEGDFANNSVILSPMKKTRANWKMIFETALEDLTGLIAPETIVYCEGRKEPDIAGLEQGLDAEIYNTIFEEEYPDVLFVSSGGSTEPDKYAEIALKVLGKAFDDVKLVILKDKDIHGDGKPTTDDEREIWLNRDINSRRMLFRREIENYLFDLEIILKLYPSLDRDKYVELINDIINEDVKSKCFRIRELCGWGQRKENDFKCELAKLVTTDTIIYKELLNALQLDRLN